MGKILGPPGPPRGSSDKVPFPGGRPLLQRTAHISKWFLSPPPEKDTRVLFLGCSLGVAPGGKGSECAGPLLK